MSQTAIEALQEAIKTARYFVLAPVEEKRFDVVYALDEAIETLGRLSASLSHTMGVKGLECHCTKIEQDETCPVGYPSLLCEDCDGKGIRSALTPTQEPVGWEKVASEAHDELLHMYRTWIADDRTAHPKPDTPLAKLLAALNAGVSKS